MSRSRSLCSSTGYVKFNRNGLTPGGGNCLATRPPTEAPTSPPSPSPTPTPTTRSPTLSPTTLSPTTSPATGTVRRVDEAGANPNADAEDDKISGVTITIIVILVIAISVAAFYGMAYWKKADVERKVVHPSFIVCSTPVSNRCGACARYSNVALLHPSHHNGSPGGRCCSFGALRLLRAAEH